MHWTLFLIAAIGILAYQRASLSVWTVGIASFLIISTAFGTFHFITDIILWAAFLLLLLPLNSYKFRQKYLSPTLLKIYQKMMPSMSRTEREALEAGTVSFEGEIFKGHPDWKKFSKLPEYQLSAEEKDFIAGPLQQLCSMIHEWDITHNRADMPKEMWEFIKDNGFFSFIIPKKFGGKEFSAQAQAAIISQLYGRSITVATTVGVPNSLGPAELLHKYGTDKQKDYYLPRLATGEEIPCFALTAPDAGSDAAAMPDNGVVCKGMFEGKEVVGIKLNWNKRYITLAPVATLLGLAFKLYDPEHLIGQEEDLGITCALIPTSTSGVVHGRRHFPLNSAFMNGPTQGKDVFIPVDWIIGGAKMAGQGWRMLMECLSAGRAITLPSSAVGASTASAMATSAYAQVRKQFNLPIGEFEGIQAPLAEMAAFSYIMDGGVKFATSLIDQGAEPAVASAILKYHTLELSRLAGNHGMDICGGKGICLGPKNYIGRHYQQGPIGITVEGANILTRNLIIFGQGAMRCHPYVFEELEAGLNNDLARFDKAIFAHIGFIFSHFVRALSLAVSGGVWVRVPTGIDKKHYKQITRYSAAFAMIAEFAMLTQGAALKRNEFLSARLGDLLSYLYLATGTLKKFADEGKHIEDKVLVDYACNYLFHRFEQQYRAIVQNFPNKWVGMLARLVAFPIGFRRRPVSDKLAKKVAKIVMQPGATRERLFAGVYKQAITNNPAGQINDAFEKLYACRELEKHFARIIRQVDEEAKADNGRAWNSKQYRGQIDEAASRDLITKDEAKQLHQAQDLRDMVVAVDDFAPEELVRAGYMDVESDILPVMKQQNKSDSDIGSGITQSVKKSDSGDSSSSDKSQSHGVA